MDWNGPLDYWNGMLEWTTGLLELTKFSKGPACPDIENEDLLLECTEPTYKSRITDISL